MGHGSAFRVRLLVFSCTIWFVLATASKGGRFHNDFEEQKTSWELAGRDCDLRLLLHNRLQSEAHSGRSCERLLVRHGLGTFAYVAHEIDPCAVISELIPRVWVKSDRVGIQMLARVVLPRSLDPKTGKPLSVLVGGEPSSLTHTWQELTIDRLERRLADQVRVLRAERGARVDKSEAFVDRLLLNIHGRVAGNTTVWIDDLSVDGYVRVTATPSGREEPGETVQPVSFPTSEPLRPAVRREGRLLLVEGRPFFPRIVQHQGESFELIEKLGFNGVWLGVCATRQQLQDARNHGLWLICPPPETAGDDWTHYDRVLAWQVGTELSLHHLPSVQTLSDRVRRSDPRNRPLVCSVVEGAAEYSRVTDIVVVYREPIGTTFNLSQYAEWLRQERAAARFDSIFWANVQSQLNEAVVRQAAAMVPGSVVEPPKVDLHQARHLAYGAIAAGMTGLWFPSRESLAQDDELTSFRRNLHQLLNLELLTIQPWATGLVPETIEADTSGVEVTTLATDHATLAVLRSVPRETQHAESQVSPRNFELILPAVEGSQLFRVSPGGLQPIGHRRAAGGVQVTVPGFHGLDLLIMTQVEQVVQRVSRQLRVTSAKSARLMLEMAESELDTLERIVLALDTHEHAGQQRLDGVEELRRTVQHAADAMSGKDYIAAKELLAQTLDRTAQMRHTIWRTESSVQPPASTTFAVQFEVLPLHRQLAEGLRHSQLGENLLPSGNFESLSHMLQDGWRQAQAPHMATRVTLTSQQPHSGSYCMCLSAQTRPERRREAISLWVASAPVPVPRGQLVRIDGWVRIDQPLQGSFDGLMVYDSLAGSSLAHRFLVTEGWQHFSMYRAADQNGQLTVTFELSGSAQAFIDDLSVRFVQPQSGTEETVLMPATNRTGSLTVLSR